MTVGQITHIYLLSRSQWRGFEGSSYNNLSTGLVSTRARGAMGDPPVGLLAYSGCAISRTDSHAYADSATWHAPC